MIRFAIVWAALLLFLPAISACVIIEGGENIIFIHKSVGHMLIQEGDVRGIFDTFDVEHGTDFRFWDHDNDGPTGVTDPDGGQHLGYDIPGDNNTPWDYRDLFQQPVNDPPDNAFSRLLANHQVIVFKSCFTMCHIESDALLDEYKGLYREMRDVMDQHPLHIFVPLSPPPLNPGDTNPANAARARSFANWLKTDFLTEGGPHLNVRVLDFFNLLAEGNPFKPGYNMLRFEYCKDGYDSHPNKAANQQVAPIFVDLLINSIM